MGSVLWCCSLNVLVHSLLVLKLFCVACGPWPGKLAMAVAELLKWRTPPILVLAWILLGFTTSVRHCQDCASVAVVMSLP